MSDRELQQEAAMEWFAQASHLMPHHLMPHQLMPDPPAPFWRAADLLERRPDRG